MIRVTAVFIACFFFISFKTGAQAPCSSPEYHQFDFWLGEWDVYGKNGQKAGDSRITNILGTCIILEEWTSVNLTRGIRYAGKSFNTWNARTKQWQQTWVDNVGGSTEFLIGEAGENKVIFSTHPFEFKKDSMAVRRLSFFKLDNNKVRQFAEISKDEGKTWTPEYDLEYRRKATPDNPVTTALIREMEEGYNTGNAEKIVSCYSTKAKVITKNVEINGREQLLDYWKKLVLLGGTWTLTKEDSESIGDAIWIKGGSVIKDKGGREHKVSFTLVLSRENGEWKIIQDAYW